MLSFVRNVCLCYVELFFEDNKEKHSEVNGGRNLALSKEWFKTYGRDYISILDAKVLFYRGRKNSYKQQKRKDYYIPLWY